MSYVDGEIEDPEVTSHAEVWIETAVRLLSGSVEIVTSHVEVWIETPAFRAFAFPSRCHLPRGGVD